MRRLAPQLQIGRAHVCTPVTLISALVPYTTLFRSIGRRWTPCRRRAKTTTQNVTCAREAFGNATVGSAASDRKSTRLHSSHTDICSRPLHDALPIYWEEVDSVQPQGEDHDA